MSTENEKDEKKSDSGPSLVTIFFVSVGASLAVHTLLRLLDKGRAPVAALPPASSDPWDFT